MSKFPNRIKNFFQPTLVELFSANNKIKSEKIRDNSSSSSKTTNNLCSMFEPTTSFSSQPSQFQLDPVLLENHRLGIEDPQLYVPLPFYDEEKWRVISRALASVRDSENLTFEDFKNIIENYSQNNLGTFQTLLAGDWRQYSEHILREVIPKMADLALSVISRISFPIEYLLVSPANCEKSMQKLVLSRHQIASLLANAFFCTFSENKRNLSYERFNDINFKSILSKPNRLKIEKLKCILYYFQSFLKKEQNEQYSDKKVSILRHAISAPNWIENSQALVELDVFSKGKIEDEGHGMLQVDFANKYIGGGVLSSGCVQEEIRFLICPELLISCLVCEKMGRNEAILIEGVERFSDYKGYGSSFRWMKRSTDESVFDDLLAIDAVCYGQFNEWVQFGQTYIDRELLKAYAGFSIPNAAAKTNGIATGNWGCGVFGGNMQLKSMIQWMASSAAERSLHYFSFGNERFADELRHVVSVLRAENITVGELYSLVCDYGEGYQNKRFSMSLFDFIRMKIEHNTHFH